MECILRQLFLADLQKPKTQNSGVEVSINKTFLWGAEEWKVLSMYLFDKGPVFHLCKRIKDETIREFYAKGLFDADGKGRPPR